MLEDLYQSGSSSLLTSQLWLSLIFLALCLVLSPLAMAWATMHYITRPILELDAVSERLIEGDLDVGDRGGREELLRRHPAAAACGRRNCCGPWTRCRVPLR